MDAQTSLPPFPGLRRLVTTSVAVVLLALATAPALAQNENDPATPVVDVEPAAAEDDTPTPMRPARATEADGPAFEIATFEPDYVRPNPKAPPVKALTQVPFDLGRTEDGYVAPRADVPIVSTTLKDLSRLEEAQTFRASAIQHILESLRDFLIERQFIGIFVAPDPFQINESGEDVRSENDTTLRLLVTLGAAAEVRTIGSGDRIDPAERIDNALHDQIRAESPVQRYTEGDPARNDLMRKDLLDRFVFHKSRHPGRRVDMAVSRADEPGTAALDYLITENRPLSFYAELSNTGTAATDQWRQRFGLLHTQLTNADDILELTYVTASFSDTNAFIGYYERPLPGNDRVRWRVGGFWSEFTASDVGAFADTFTGESFGLNGDIVANIYQDREFFLDLVGGVRWFDSEINNVLIGKGEGDWVLPYVGVRIDRTTGWESTRGQVHVEFSSADWTDISDDNLTRLGRLFPDRDFAILQWRFRHSVFLEPLLNRAAWEDPSTPESSTLAHELFIAFRGQYSFDKRLVAQLNRPVGGLYTVRGYPESVVAGDSALILNLEYRYHLPRAFKIQQSPTELFGEPFRLAPQYVYGSPDWDLILKAFCDVGATYIVDPLSFESDETLVSIGIGAEFTYRRNLRARLDWGFAVDSIPSRGVSQWDERVHFLLSVLF